MSQRQYRGRYRSLVLPVANESASRLGLRSESVSSLTLFSIHQVWPAQQMRSGKIVWE